MTIDEVLAKEEKQIFDRKSIQIRPAELSAAVCAFANADGGTIAIGISDKHRRIEGVDDHTEQFNEILRTPIDFCNPTVPVKTEMIECVNSDGKPDHVLLMHIEASPLLHANQADEAFLRVGDKNKKLNFNDRMTLMYAKGVRYYEDEPVDSPGTFAGMVKKENIRYTHFSRNPKIAAFLKDYGYVKEYGEGVDRMCKELETIGLPDPMFNNSTFILKTTVMSASFGNKTTGSASFRPENASVEQNDASFRGKDGLIARLHKAETDRKISAKDMTDAALVIDNVDVMQVITSKEIMRILSCRTTKARMVIKVLETQRLIKPIQGKGKYILNVSEEVDD